MLPIWTEGDRKNTILVPSQRRNNLHTFDTGICHQFISISQHLLIDFRFFHNREAQLASRTASTPTPTEGKERKPMETIPVPPEEK
jgi:hypothetical protein